MAQFCIETIPEVSENEICQIIGFYADFVLNIFFCVEIILRIYLATSGGC